MAMQTSERHPNYKVVSMQYGIGCSQIAKKDLFHEAIPTIITTILPMGNGHSMGAELLVLPVRDSHRFPGHTFYRNTLACETCCENIILAEAERSTKAWACDVNSQLWYRSDCDFQSLSVAPAVQFCHPAPCFPQRAARCLDAPVRPCLPPPNPVSAATQSAASAVAVAVTAVTAAAAAAAERTHHSPSKRSAPDSISDQRSSSRLRTVTSLDESIANCARCLMNDIKVGYKTIVDEDNQYDWLNLLDSPAASTTQDFEQIEEWLWRNGDADRVESFMWHVTAGLVAILNPYRQSTMEKSKRTRWKKLAMIIVALVSDLVPYQQRKAMATLSCLACSKISSHSLTKAVLEKVPITEISAVAQRTSKSLREDTSINWSQIPASGLFNPVFFISARSKKLPSEVASLLLTRIRDANPVKNAMVNDWPTTLPATVVTERTDESERSRPPLHDKARFLQQNDNGPGRPIYAADPNGSSHHALLQILFSLGGRNIPLDTFDGIRSDQKRWSNDGAPKTIELREIGLPSLVQHLFAEEKSLNLVINDLRSNSRITRHESADAEPLYSLSCGEISRLEGAPSDEKKLWNSWAITIMCFLFPTDQFIDESFYLRGKTMAPLVRRLILSGDSMADLQIPSNIEIADMVLALSRFGTIPQRLEAIGLAERLPSLPEYLSVAIATRKSVLLRLGGKLDEAQQYLEHTMTREWFPYRYDRAAEIDESKCQNRRHYAECGRLLLSLVECQLQLGQPLEASETICLWVPHDVPHSPLEYYILRSKHILAARLFRWRGDFQSAHEWLQSTMKMVDREDGNRAQVVAHTADVLCELGQAANAESTLKEDYVYWNQNRPSSKGCRRLQVSYAETLIKLHRLTDAEEALRSSIVYYQHPQAFDAVDGVLMVRAFLCRALLSHFRGSEIGWESVEQSWRDATERIKQSKAFAYPGFADSVVRLWILDTQFRRGTADNLTPQIIELTKYTTAHRQYCITGLGTYWLDKVLDMLASQDSGFMQWKRGHVLAAMPR